MSEEIKNSIQSYNSYFLDDEKDLCTNKAYKKCHLVIHTYNDKKKQCATVFTKNNNSQPGY